MRFTQRREELADRLHVLAELEMPVGAKTLQVDQAAARTLDALAHKVVGGVPVGGLVKHLFIDRVHGAAHSAQRLHPPMFVVGMGKQCIDTGFA